MRYEIVLFTVLLVLLVSLVVFLRHREGRYLKRRTSEAFSPELKAEIEEERKQNSERREKFEEALKRAGGA